MIDHISPSQVDTFYRCAYQWFLRYIEGIISPPGIAAHVGSGVHKGVEVDLKAKILTGEDEPEDVVVDAAVTAYDARLKKQGVYLSREDAAEAPKLMGKGKDDTVKLPKKWYGEVAPVTKPALVEEKIRIQIPGIDQVAFLGIIDLLETDGTLRDLKTSGKKKNQQWADAETQPTFYKELVKAMTGEYPSKIAYTILLNKKEAEVQTLVTERDASDWEVLICKVKNMLSQVNAGNFGPAAPGAWNCGPKWCGYWANCKYISDRQKVLPRIQ